MTSSTFDKAVCDVTGTCKGSIAALRDVPRDLTTTLISWLRLVGRVLHGLVHVVGLSVRSGSRWVKKSIEVVGGVQNTGLNGPFPEPAVVSGQTKY